MTPSVPKHISFDPKFDSENPIHCNKASIINFVKLFAKALFTTCYKDSKIKIHFHPSTINTCIFTQLWQLIVVTLSQLMAMNRASCIAMRVDCRTTLFIHSTIFHPKVLDQSPLIQEMIWQQTAQIHGLHDVGWVSTCVYHFDRQFQEEEFID